MSWTPNYSGEPHAFAEVLVGPIPFTPNEGTRGELDGQGASGALSLEFQSVLLGVPEPCLEESIALVWLYGKGLTAEAVTLPSGWEAADVEALPGWPASCVMLYSPEDFRGRGVEFSVSVPVSRAVALMEWRGEPEVVRFTSSGGGGGVIVS